MKNTILAILLVLMALLTVGCEDFLTRPPMDQMTDETYWTSEENVKSFAWDFYPHFFSGYGSGYAWGRYYRGQSLNDNLIATAPVDFVENVPTSGGGFSFGYVRKANLMLDRVKGVPMGEEAVEHWKGVSRFFRALEYNNLVQRFGDIQWYDKVLTKDDEALYKKRDDRIKVMDNVLADFQYAIENVRLDAGTAGLTVNKDVVLAFMSRVFLYHGTYLKYHDLNQEKAKEYLRAAQSAAKQLIESGRYELASDYRGLFTSLSLDGNPEIIMYRKYEEGVLTHSLNSYSNDESQVYGLTKDAVDSYLVNDGLPIEQSPNYEGDTTIQQVMTNRDPRISETMADKLRLSGMDGLERGYSVTGYAQHKFLNEDIADQTIGSSNLNPTDAPVIRYGEVLLNYAEATYELGELTNSDLDKSINVLRSRTGIDMPALQVSGEQAMVNGQVITDPDRDPNVSGILWEIRRERRVELMMEGFRLDDLKRWKKLEYVDTIDNPDINRGAWISLDDYPEANVYIEGGNNEGYIVPASEQQAQRRFDDERVYLSPLPLDQITLFKNHGVDLEQNPGW